MDRYRINFFLLIVVIPFLLIFTGCNPKVSRGHIKKWTYLFYNDADFAGSWDPMEDFCRDMYGGDNLNVLVLRDIHSDGAEMFNPFVGQETNDLSAGIFLIKDRSNPVLLKSMGEINMGSPDTLSDFILYGKSLFPAERYILAFFNHGGGYLGSCWDDTNGDWLSMEETRRGIHDGSGVDIIMFTGPCLMGAIESVYQVRSQAEVYIGSENTSSYGVWLQPIMENIHDMLSNQSSIDTYQLGREIIKSIEKNMYWVENLYPDWIGQETMSAVRTDKITDVAVLFTEITAYYLANQERFNLFMDQNYAEIQTYADKNMDLISFLTKLVIYENNTQIKSRINLLISKFSEAVLYETHGDDYSDSHGLTLYFPNRADQTFDNRYSDVQFAQHTRWDLLIGRYFDARGVARENLDPMKIFRNIRPFQHGAESDGGNS